ncbi:MAG TPA: M20/M25/M40 family metallo-hydrolase [Pyrinomonadaceae bacterium]|nr:M20/M25/M40 family metallo-hydrolase [Pyrinomonadaceae bacterium]
MQEALSLGKKMNPFGFARQLIDIPSLTGDEKAVGEFLATFLAGLGYKIQSQEAARDRFNVIATTGEAPRIVFSTHMDTVPPFIASSEDGEYIYGRGSCDAKGIIAAQVFAAEQLRIDGITGIGLLFTVDEELSSIGAQVANKHPLARECRFLINGEPTDNRLATGTKGSLRLIVTTEGRAAHSAYPEAGESAVEKLLDILHDIRACDWPGDSFFGDTTCNIGVLNGGTRPNVIPDHARAELQIRLATDIERIKPVVEQAIAGRAQVEYLSAHDPVRLLSVAGFDDCVVRFTTDVPYLSNWGKPLLLGPGSILDAHTDHERIAKHELEGAVDLYVALAKKLNAL